MSGSTFLIDTQATISIIKLSAIASEYNIKNKIDNTEIIIIKGVTPYTIESLGTIRTKLQVDDFWLDCTFHVVTDEFDVPSDGILGKDFFRNYKCGICYDTCSLTIKVDNEILYVPMLDGPDENSIVLPARCESIRKFNLTNKEDCLIPNQEILPGIFIPNTIVSENAMIKIMNTNSTIQKIPKDIPIKIEKLEKYSILNTHAIEKKAQRDKDLRKIVSEHVDPDNKAQLLKLVENFADIFHMENDKMSVNNFYEQKLRIHDNNPVYIKNYRSPHFQKDETKKQVQKLIDNELVEPSTSNYNSPILLVPKKGDKWRLCIDYRQVNKKLIADKYPLPRIEDILDNLGRAKFFSILDMYSGFHQIPLHEDSRDITSFSTEGGSFRWKVLPFGLNVSPNSFSRMMSLAFAGISPLQCFIYMDDIIVIGCSEKHHIKNLSSVFEVCRKYNLKLNPNKCDFFRTEVTYLGHKCSDKGILPDDSKFEVIRNFPMPENKDEVKRFIALANYYRKFIPHFAELAKPLNQLTKLRVPFIWSAMCQGNFETLKNRIINAVILQYPDYSKEFILTVDASKVAAGAVLSQNFDGNDLPISFASKTFTKGEINKSTIERELTAIYFAVKHYRPYLYGKHFTIKSDHKPLSYLFALREPSSKLTRMRIELEEYQFTIEYIKGKDNVVADALSRITIDELKQVRHNTAEIRVTTRSMTKEPIIKDSHNVKEINDCDKTEKIAEIQCYEGNNECKVPKLQFKVANEEIINLKVYTKRKRIISVDSSSFVYNDDNTLSLDLGPDATANWSINEKVSLVSFLSKLEEKACSHKIARIKINSNDDIFKLYTIDNFKQACNENLKELIIIITRVPKIIVDDKEKIELMEKYHNDPIHGGHTGQKKLYAKLKSSYYWKHMSKDIVKFVRNCEKCMVNKAKNKHVEPMQITDTPKKIFELIIIDTIGPFKTSINGNKYAVTMICDLTKYLITASIPDKEARSIAKAIFENCILIFGPMKNILSDRGTEYVNEIARELFELFGVQHRTSTAYHHETLGSIERNHRVFNEYLRAYVNDQRDNWDEYLKCFTYCYNITPHSTFENKYSPFELVFSKSPIVQEFILTGKIDPVYNIDNYVKEAKFKLQVMHKKASEFLEISKAKNKLSYDKKVTNVKFNLNDSVLLRNEQRNKLEPLYSGPFVILEILESNVKLRNLKTNKEIVVHKNRIVKWKK